MDLLARREHSCEELRHKLRERFDDGEEAGLTEELIDEVLAGLVEDDLLSDERFAESYIRLRIRKGFGLLKIEAELAQRGVESSLIRDELHDSGTDWVQHAADQLERKFGQRMPDTAHQQQQFYRFLVQRGFGSEHIRAAMKHDK